MAQNLLSSYWRKWDWFDTNYSEQIQSSSHSFSLWFSLCLPIVWFYLFLGTEAKLIGSNSPSPHPLPFVKTGSVFIQFQPSAPYPCTSALPISAKSPEISSAEHELYQAQPIAKPKHPLTCSFPIKKSSPMSLILSLSILLGRIQSRWLLF